MNAGVLPRIVRTWADKNSARLIFLDGPVPSEAFWVPEEAEEIDTLAKVNGKYDYSRLIWFEGVPAAQAAKMGFTTEGITLPLFGERRLPSAEERAVLEKIDACLYPPEAAE